MKEPMSYVGIAPCGCTRAACVDLAGVSEMWKRETADFCREIVQSGLRLELRDTQQVREAKWACEKCDPTMFAQQQEIFAPASSLGTPEDGK